jgi:predicted HAD superfamily phosphohydrolase
MANNYIAFDLEGPLSPRDNAYDLMKLFPNGDKILRLSAVMMIF